MEHAPILCKNIVIFQVGAANSVICFEWPKPEPWNSSISPAQEQLGFLAGQKWERKTVKVQMTFFHTWTTQASALGDSYPNYSGVRWVFSSFLHRKGQDRTDWQFWQWRGLVIKSVWGHLHDLKAICPEGNSYSLSWSKRSIPTKIRIKIYW